MYNNLPFRKVLKCMVIELVYAMTFYLHAFPVRHGFSATLSPREMVTGVDLDANKHCLVPFVAYVQSHEEHDKIMASRTIGAIALRPIGNAQGGHYFYSLPTGRSISRNKWTKGPMPADVIARVEKMAEFQTAKRLTSGDRQNEAER